MRNLTVSNFANRFKKRPLVNNNLTVIPVWDIRTLCSRLCRRRKGIWVRYPDRISSMLLILRPIYPTNSGKPGNFEIFTLLNWREERGKERRGFVSVIRKSSTCSLRHKLRMDGSFAESYEYFRCLLRKFAQKSAKAYEYYVKKISELVQKLHQVKNGREG